uniref:Uncharacterized protein n=1 Tax=Amphiprion ocellaris TaxID=80972 RepID=A0AAQ6AJP6_AMPOC
NMTVSCYLINCHSDPPAINVRMLYFTCLSWVSFLGHQFNIQTYNSTDLRKIKGRAVMLYVYKNKKKMVACCCGNSEIRAKEMEIPTDLHKTSDEALFYMVKLSAPSSYQFESTLYPGRFLGFQHDGNNASRHKLVLIQGRNEVDNFCPMQMEKF